MFLCAKKRTFATQTRAIALMTAVGILIGAAAVHRWVPSPWNEDNTEPATPSYSQGAVSSQDQACPSDAVAAVPPMNLSAKAAVLMEADSGTVIFGKSPDTPLPMASTTKIMTALVALEQIPLHTVITVPVEAVGIEGSSVYLTEGERLTVEELLYALLLASANDAAVAIAIAVGGSVEGFAQLMNQKAAELGLTSTHFENPHGLDAEGHYTTARELAIIARAALEEPRFREICSTRRKAISKDGLEKGRWLLNHNKLLSMYPDCIGVKTGYTKKTGRCLVSAARREGVTLIAVTLGAPDDWRDHTAMLDHGFEQYSSVTLCGEGDVSTPLPILSGTREYVIAENRQALRLTLPKDHGPIRCVTELPPFEFAPIQSGQTVGRLVFYEERPDGSFRKLGEVPLTATYEVPAAVYRRSLWERIRERIAKA